MLYLSLAAFGCGALSLIVSLFALAVAAEAKHAANLATQRMNWFSRWLKENGAR